MITQEIILKSGSYGIHPVVHMVQNDTGRTLRMILDDITVTSSMTAVLAIHRPDDSFYSETANRNTANNAFSADATQALTRPGLVKCQLKVTDENDLVTSTFRFDIQVEKSTDGLPVEQLGYDIYDLIEAAQTISPPVLVVEDDGQGNVTLSLGVDNGV